MKNRDQLETLQKEMNELVVEIYIFSNHFKIYMVVTNVKAEKAQDQNVILVRLIYVKPQY